jgi:hypothetical protein
MTPGFDSRSEAKRSPSCRPKYQPAMSTRTETTKGSAPFPKLVRVPQSWGSGIHAEAPVHAGASAAEREGKRCGKRPTFRSLPWLDVGQRVKVWSKTVTPPWTTVILTLVNVMSVIVAVQLPFGQPAS